MADGGTHTAQRVTQSERILAVLADGNFHTAAELYRTGCVLHSRISSLRKRGYLIESRHVGGTGAEAWEYRLAATPEKTAEAGEPLTSPPAVFSGASADGGQHGDGEAPVFIEGQLSLLGAAA